MNNWKSTADELPPDGKIVHTKLHDSTGVRNEQLLKRQGNLWVFDDGLTHIYYTPTHWREEVESERELRVAKDRVAELERHNRRMAEIES